MGLTAEQTTDSFVFSFLHKKCEWCDECQNGDELYDINKFKSCIIKEIDESVKRCGY